MSYISYILLSALPMSVCAFWTLNFSLQYTKSHITKKILFWFMLTASLLYFAHFIVFNHIYTLIPLTDTIYTFSTLSVYLIFYLYILSLTGKLHLYHSFILLPGFIVAGIIGLCYLLMPKGDMISFIKYCHYGQSHIPTSTFFPNISMIFHQLMKYIIAAEILIVLPLGLKRLTLFQGKVKEYYSNTEHKDLKSIRILLLVFVLTSFLSIIVDLIGRAYFVNSLVLISIPSISFSTLLFFIGYIGNNQKFTITDLNQEEIVPTPSPNYVQEKEVTTKEQMELMNEINTIMKEKRLFLKADLKLSELASYLNTNRTYVYQALKSGSPEGSSLSFPDYVNRFRIEYSLELLKSNDYSNIESIIYECGFLSKATFYKNFKKQTGKTPKQFINEAKKQEEKRQ